MTENFFPTLGDGLDAVRAYLMKSGATLAEYDRFFDTFAIGGVGYGQTKHALGVLATFKGKPLTGRRIRTLSVTVYRMETGTYEFVAYIS